MSTKISQLPNLTVAQLITTGTTASWPVVANTGTVQATYQTTVGNIKTYVETGNLNVTGSINGNLTSILANLIITGNLSVQGTTTTTSSQNVSTNSSIIDLHTFNSNLGPWTSDDGRDIGLRFFWYKGSTAGTSALVWENSNSYLTWYGTGVSNANTGAVSGTLGTMQLGQLLVSNNTATTANATGALQVSGGISSGGNLWATGWVRGSSFISTTGPGTFSALQSNGAANVGGTLIVTGAGTVASLKVNSFITIGTTLVTSGNTTANGLSVNNSATVGTSLSVGTSLAVTGNITCDTISSTNNGNGTNFKIGDDAWIGDISIANTLRVAGNQDDTQGYIVFGNTNTLSLGRSGNSALTYQGGFTAQGGLQNTPIGNATATTATFTTVRTGSVIPTTANTFTLGNSSTWYSAVYATAVQSYYADLAEKYIADQEYEPGTVVVFGGTEEITVTSKLEDRRVAGVISTDPAYLMNMSSAGLPVALRGKVPVKIIGQVSKGDLLVTSELPGHGISVGFRSDYSPNAVFAKSLVDDKAHEARVIWAVIL